MDYSGFAQMVLGANLFPMKSGQVTNIVKGGTTKINNLNHTAIYDNIVKSKIDVGFDEQVVRNTLGMIGDESFDTPKNPVEMDKYLSKKYTSSMQRYTYLRLIDFDQYSRIFKNQEVDGELLILICRTFYEQVI